VASTGATTHRRKSAFDHSFKGSYSAKRFAISPRSAAKGQVAVNASAAGEARRPRAAAAAINSSSRAAASAR